VIEKMVARDGVEPPTTAAWSADGDRDQIRASEDALRSGLKVISLVDAFSPNAVAKAAAASGVADPNWVK
jgi:hypothetical protein